ncbi:MAG: hypothetical protein DCC55_08850 [Chloroflexi bacterium]|nr:MAG: hypothetical protein DCC55_08850 [Chloroflexota bacterium]
MMYIDTLAEIQRERHAELLREANERRLLKAATGAGTTSDQANSPAERNPVAGLVATLLTLPERLKTA